MQHQHCPECGKEVSRHRYHDLANDRIASGVTCPGCKTFWNSEERFEASCQMYDDVRHIPHRICRVCGKDSNHRMDSAWRKLDGVGPAICPSCIVCSSCGCLAFQFDQEKREVTCEVCGTRWASSKEFEQALLGRTWELGIKITQ